ncbi:MULTISPECIES: hypothetical protein [Bacillaceae]|uniref:Secreted protein n=1 Tax=Gottfriedia luciferensis TaxID=178774 RepID=A0ABX2ZTB0_9BACI|nr:MULTISPECIES: hypothetical protein [Bacillaceae]ODG92599.1 hypothetical protein BED47_19360 [Gottfriedia luciferensis]PGZ93092.1 hypothetical protein COE53_08240 [Bacillus sp. AFS029533]
MKYLLLILSFFTVIGLSGCESKTHVGSTHQNMNHETKEKKDTTQVSFSFNGTPESNNKVDLNIQVNSLKGKPVDQFELEHEKLMHLIIVSKDLSFFDHLHPQYKGKGLFTVIPNFPNGGEYKLFTDFIPKGSDKNVKSKLVKVTGQPAGPVSLIPDKVLTKVIDGKEITLKFDKLATDQEVKMTYTIKDAKTKKEINDLQPYLGAVGHVVAISGDTNTYLHVHPMNEKSSGPVAEFMTSFPKKGLYKIWGQFKQNGNVFIVPFIVDVP